MSAKQRPIDPRDIARRLAQAYRILGIDVARPETMSTSAASTAEAEPPRDRPHAAANTPASAAAGALV